MKKLVFVFLLSLLIAASAGAVAIGPDCPTCQGGIYDITYVFISSNASSEVYDLTLSIDLTNYWGGGYFISDVAIKPASSLTSFVLSDAPGGAALWATGLGGLNANGCDGSGSGFGCSSAVGLGAPVSSQNLEWSWLATMPVGAFFGNDDPASVKVRFADFDGDKVGALVSENTYMGGEVPEPATFVLFGSSLLAIAFLSRRARKKKDRT